VNALVLFKFEQERIEGSEILGGRIGVEVEDGGETEAKEEVVGCAAGLIAGCGGGQARQVGL
jgi:hypothetical protein